MLAREFSPLEDFLSRNSLGITRCVFKYQVLNKWVVTFLNKSFWIPLFASFGSMILLYVIGFMANIDFLIFKMTLSYTEISFIPIIVGLLIGLIIERMLKRQISKNDY